MTGRPKHFWSSWPPASQRRFFRNALGGTLLLSLAAVVGLRLFTATAVETIEQSKTQYARVTPIVTEIQALRAQQGDLAHLPVDEAVWAVVDELDVQDSVASLRSTRLSEDEVGVQATFEGLSLTQMVDLFQALRDRAGIQTPECDITRNPDDPRLADVRLVAAR